MTRCYEIIDDHSNKGQEIVYDDLKYCENGQVAWLQVWIICKLSSGVNRVKCDSEEVQKKEKPRYVVWR